MTRHGALLNIWKRHASSSRALGGRRRFAATAILAVILSAIAASASAQVDTPAAREARAALRLATRNNASRAGGTELSYRLALADVAYELRMADRADPAVLAATVEKLRAGAQTDFSDPIYQQLAGALARRISELRSVPRDRWPAACGEQSQKYAKVTAAEVKTAREALLVRLDALQRVLPSVSTSGDSWNEFLFWSETHDLVFKDTRDLALLERLESRWQGAPLVWDAPELLEASLAVQSYIPLYRAWLAKETPETRVAAWTELGELLDGDPSAASPNAARIAVLVDERESLGQATALTASIRREFSRPNVILRARTAWVQDQLSENISDRYTVNGVYAGVRQYGQGTLTGTMKCRILPSQSVGYAEFLFDSTARARTRGSSEGVTVVSTATTRIQGRKPFVLGAQGLTTSPATVTANASVVFNSIDSPGLRRRQEEARRRTYARRPQAEAGAEADARRDTEAEMNTQGAKLVEEFNKSYTALRDRQFATHRRAPEIRVRADADTLRWECRLESPALFAAPGEPPPFDATADVTLCLAASALEEQAFASLADKQMTGGELSQAIAEIMGGDVDESGKNQDFTATFAKYPCKVQLADGQIRTKFYITAFDSDDVKYPAMTVDAEYNVEQRAGDLALVRQGSLRVRPWNIEEDKPAEISGRQQTLRVAVQRKLNRALAETYVWSSPKLPIDDSTETTLRVEAAQVAGGWLQVALKSAATPAKPAN